MVSDIAEKCKSTGMADYEAGTRRRNTGIIGRYA